MCELFAMSSLYPSTVKFSLDKFARHGGLTGPHKDGWGIAFYDGRDARLIKDEGSASSSRYLSFIRDQNFTSQLILSHIQRATQGEITYSNTQPFQRELMGRIHTFAHNGDLKGFKELAEDSFQHYHPLGDTDSELAFCYLAELLTEIWRSDFTPSLHQRMDLIANFAKTISQYGPANFIYSDGEYLFTHGHIRKQLGKEGFHPPGLFTLKRSCQPGHSIETIQGLEFADRNQQQEVVLVASVPLTKENWKPLAEGELLVLMNGKIIDSGMDLANKKLTSPANYRNSA